MTADRASTPGRAAKGLEVLVLFILAARAAPARAQHPVLVPDRPLAELTPAALEGVVKLSVGWRYHPGDDPAYAAPSLDDQTWSLANSSLQDPRAMPGGWPGIGWFRRTISLAPGMPRTVLALFVDQMGASEVFFDGAVIGRFGTVAKTPEAERLFFPRRFVSLVLEPGSGHVLAVRFSNVSLGALQPHQTGFAVYLRPVEAMSVAAVSLVRRLTGATAGFVGVFAAFALLHLLLWAFRPRSREHLFFALFTAFIAANLLAEMRLNNAEEAGPALLNLGLTAVTAVGIVVSGLALEHAVFGRRPSWWTCLVCGAGAVMLVWLFMSTAFRPILVAEIYLLLGAAEMLRVAVLAVRRGERDAWIVAAGFGVLTLTVFLQQGAQILGATIPPTLPYGVALVALVLSFTAYLSRRVARTHRELEERLAEVQALSTRAVEQERRAAREEAGRLVLAAENERKTRELEDARRMQLAMLPPSSPHHEGYDVAFRMATATEVGGDYVDVAPCGNALLVAVGDATSHGLQAGMVVAVAKSLFQTSRAEPSPAAILRRISEGLAALRERRASMALAVLRLDASSVTVASAGMPPLLVFRSRTGAVEEVLIPALPLGARQDARWEDRRIPVESGDVILAASDGLAEAVDPLGEQFGYDRLSALFAGLASRDAAGIVDGMLAGAFSFLGGAGLEDDFTAVAMKAR